MKLKLLTALFMIVGAVGLLQQPVWAADIMPDCLATDKSLCKLVEEDKLNYKTGATGVWGIIQIVMMILAGVAVVMIVIGGVKYTISQGDSTALTSAKNTILYAIIGLVVAILATTIIGFVNSYFA